MRQMQETNIFIGNLSDAGNKKQLDKHNIKIIFNVCNDIDTPLTGDRIYVKWGLDDPKDGLAPKNEVECAATVLQMLFHKAQNIDGNVLVHCAAGHNRSALVVAVWGVHYNNLGLAEAVKSAKVKDKKNWMINKGFDW